jgi:hypothetical protein
MQHKYYNYKNNICKKFMLAVETQEHILKCNICAEREREKLKNKYLFELTLTLERHRINRETKIVISQKVRNWLYNNKKV